MASKYHSKMDNLKRTQQQIDGECFVVVAVVIVDRHRHDVRSFFVFLDFVIGSDILFENARRLAVPFLLNSHIISVLVDSLSLFVC